MKLVLTVEIEVSDINKKDDVYDRLIANDRVINFVEQQCGCGYVTDITLQDKVQSLKLPKVLKKKKFDND